MVALDVRRYEDVSEWPLAVLALIFLVAFAVPILRPDLPSDVDHTLQVIDTVAWIGFGLDYLLRIGLARTWHYFWTHLLDLGMVALPILRPLRLLRILMLFRVLERRAIDSLHGRVAIYTAGTAILLVLCSSLAILDAERGRPGSNIENFGDALWWAMTTITTVGYGDTYPVTTEGRFIAVALMVGGVAIIGITTATAASWLIDKLQDVAEEAQTATRGDIAELAHVVEGTVTGGSDSGGGDDPGAVRPRGGSVADTLGALAELTREGWLTSEEFAAAKRRVLADRPAATTAQRATAPTDR